MLIGKDALCGLIPHAGSMCLLDNVLDWNETEIRCSATSHIDTANPLRNGGRLASVHLLEYGAQAMAVHGGLLALESGSTVPPGYLAALRNVILHLDYIDDAVSPLIVHARLLASLSTSFMYHFTITAANASLASARATVSVRKDAGP